MRMINIASLKVQELSADLACLLIMIWGSTNTAQSAIHRDWPFLVGEVRIDACCILQSCS